MPKFLLNFNWQLPVSRLLDSKLVANFLYFSLRSLRGFIDKEKLLPSLNDVVHLSHEEYEDFSSVTLPVAAKLWILDLIWNGCVIKWMNNGNLSGQLTSNSNEVTGWFYCHHLLFSPLEKDVEEFVITSLKTLYL